MNLNKYLVLYIKGKKYYQKNSRFLNIYNNEIINIKLLLLRLTCKLQLKQRVISIIWNILIITSTTYSLFKAFYYRGLAKDMEKNLLFMDNNTLFDSKKKANDNTFTDNKTMEQSINLNVVDSMSIEEVKNLIEIARLTNETNLPFSEIPKVGAKVLRKKK